MACFLLELSLLDGSFLRPPGFFNETVHSVSPRDSSRRPQNPRGRLCEHTHVVLLLWHDHWLRRTRSSSQPPFHGRVRADYDWLQVNSVTSRARLPAHCMRHTSHMPPSSSDISQSLRSSETLEDTKSCEELIHVPCTAHTHSIPASASLDETNTHIGRAGRVRAVNRRMS